MSEKETTVMKVEVTNMSIDEIASVVYEVVQRQRLRGWHFSSHMPVDWLLEKGKPKQYVLCTFCK